MFQLWDLRSHDQRLSLTYILFDIQPENQDNSTMETEIENQDMIEIIEIETMTEEAEAEATIDTRNTEEEVQAPEADSYTIKNQNIGK